MSTALFVLLFLVLGIGVVLIAMQSGSKGPLLDPNKKGSRRLLAWGIGIIVVVFAIAVPVAVAIDNNDTAEKQAGPLRLTAAQKHGRELFNRNCVQCHTLKASNSVQLIGPNLDQLRPPAALVKDAIAKGRARGQGQMPAGLVSGHDAAAIADYVSHVAGRG